MRKPLIALTMGDPAGIGPEIIVKALTDDVLISKVTPVVIGDGSVLKLAMKITNVDLRINKIKDPRDALDKKAILNLIDLNNINIDEFVWGKISALCGRAAFEYIEKSIEMTMEGEFDGVCTAPVNKESLSAAKIPYIGHTEIFADLTGTKDPLTLFETRGMRVFFLTRHVSLREVPDLVTKDRITDYVKRCTAVLRQIGVTEGTMAVAGLNPHCGEHGLFGKEETEEIEPAVKELQSLGYDVAGPVGADSVFHQCMTGKYNSVLSLYHDQGHIAAKTLDFHRTVSITGGMPILRTSVDHGTAFDIAGKGVADEVSMVEALLLAGKYSGKYSRF